MLRFLFPRLFGNFREGAIVHTKFVTTGTGTGVTFALKTSVSSANYPMTLVRTGVGLYTLTLQAQPPGVKAFAMLGMGIILTATATLVGGSLAPAGQAAFVPASGTIALQQVLSAGGAAADTITAGDEVHFTLYVDR